MTRRAKIVCTLGPAVNTPEGITDLVNAGMNVARLNFSHGTHEDHRYAYELVRQAAKETSKPVAILADLQGPKIRLGCFQEHTVMWKTGDTVTITVADVPGTHDTVSTTYKHLAEDVKVGDRLLIDDGKVAVEVIGVSGDDVRCLVIEGGPVSNHKGLSLPNVAVSIPALSEKDIDDLKFALELGADWIALSFVRSPDDIHDVHKIMDSINIRRPVIAKIEKPEAVECLEEIVAAFDAIMVARGDLGVELPLEKVPLVQKKAVILCRENAKPVIVATQMLDSMIENSRPTRAEASDVANAVLDGADALMLSGETSVGKHAVAAVETMSRVITTVEESNFDIAPLRHNPKTRGGAVSAAAQQIGEVLDAHAIVAFTLTGDTARRLARHHPRLPLLALTPLPEVQRQLALSWGIETYMVDMVSHTDEMVKQVDNALLREDRVKPGDYVVVVAGSPPGLAGSTNALRIHEIGSVDDFR